MKGKLISKEEKKYKRNLYMNQQNLKKAKNIWIIYPTFYFLVLFLSLIHPNLSLSLTRKECSHLNEITIKINGLEDQYILNNDFYYCPETIYLNGNSVSAVETNCKIINIPSGGESTNEVKLVWNEKLVSLAGIFSGLANLIEVDLSNFDSSSVIDMANMFFVSENLKIVDFSNFNTEKVVSMSQMFRGCHSIISLDLSSFDTSEVTNMYCMFMDCFQLPSLNLSNFRTSKVENMYEMFWNCQSLTSLDVSNFDTSLITSMYGLFAYCYNLKKLDLSSFRTPNVTDMTGLFFACTNLESLDISNFDTGNVELMTYMFYHCYKLSSLDLSSFNTESVINTDLMFSNCQSLTSLDLSGFHTPNLLSMNNMFESCYVLTSLNISNFNTEKVTSLNALFFNCLNLKSLDLSSFNTAKVTNMNSMFYECDSLASLDLTNFDTSNVIDMRYIFCHCKSLVDLNLGNFKTNSAVDMQAMFADCPSLTSLDLSSFDTSHVTSMSEMFYNCPNLLELDLSNFDTSSLNSFYSMFEKCYNIEYINFNNYNELNGIVMNNVLENIRDNIVICIDDTNKITNNFKNIIVTTKLCPNIYCGDDWREHIRKIIPETNTCADDCSGFEYENDNMCYSTCPEGAEFCQDKIETTNIATTDNFEGNDIETTNMATTDNFEGNDIETTNMDTTDNIKEEDIETTNIITTDNFEGENLLDTTNILNTNTQKEETLSAKISSMIIDNSTNSDIISNVITNNENYYINDSLTNQHDIETNNLNIHSSSPITNSIIEVNHQEEIKTFNIKGENNEEIYQEIIDIINNYNLSDIDDLTIEGDDSFRYQITTTDKEKNSLDKKNNNNDQISKIDLGECENILKDQYHIDRNVSLIIVKFEKVKNISLERIIQYEVYHPFNKSKLDLSLCGNNKINIYTPVELSDQLLNLYNELKNKGYDLFNINSPFYQDICTPFKSPNGTDVPLSDRINYYYNNNETLCQSNCKFSDYNIETKLLKCECDTTNSEIDTKIIKKFTKKTIYQSFYDTFKFSNYKVLWCYKLAFHINSVTINKGSIIAIIYFSIYLIFLIIYSIKGIKQLKIYYSKIMDNNKKLDVNHFNNDYSKVTEKKNIINASNISSTKRNTLKLKSTSKTLRIISKNKTKKMFHVPPKKKSISIAINKSRSKSLKNLTRNLQIYKRKSSDNNLLISNKMNSLVKSSDKNFEFQSKNNNINNVTEKGENNEEEKLDNFELNNLEYDMAKKLDKRSFIAIYWSILKREHLILFTFFTRNDYNLIIVKLSRFIFSVCTDMCLNVFFFSDETMHKMYLDYGKYNFIQQIPQILYSTIASKLIEVFLCFLSLTDKYFYIIKNLEYNSRYQIFNIIKCIKIKLVFYFIFTFLMFAFYWYAIACFCAVYHNTQMAFIKDSILSFILGLLYPFILYLFPATLRIISLKAGKSNLSCIYSTSNIIPIF